MSIDWPIRAEDGALDPGVWTVGISVDQADDVDAWDAPVHVALTVGCGAAPQRLPVMVVLTGGLEQDAVNYPVFEAAISHWADIFAQADLAGSDGLFDDAEVEQLGITLAHEVGHYLGLMHPVEETWDEYDALDDTPFCTDTRSCDHDLATNLMFPVGDAGTAQTDLTPDQIAVLQNWPGLE